MGPGLQVKRTKTEKVLTRDWRISLLQDQKVLSGRVFEPTAKNSLGMREFVEAVKFQGDTCLNGLCHFFMNGR